MKTQLKHRGLVLSVLLLTAKVAFAQGSAWQLESRSYGIMDRMEIKSGRPTSFNPALRPYDRGLVAQYLHDLDSAAWLTRLDREDLRWADLNNNEWVVPPLYEKTLTSARLGHLQQVGTDSLGPIYRVVAGSQIEACMADDKYARCQKPLLRYFYRTPGNWLEINQPFFHIRINPILNLQVARQDDGKTLFFNQRGVELRGGVDDRLYFYTSFFDTQARFADYVSDFITKNKAVPHNGYYKSYQSSVIDSKGAYDFNNGQGHIGFLVTPHVGLEFGHGRNFIGNGYRSLFLSDFSHNYLYLKAKWQLWRFTYQNLFAQLQSTSAQANPGENYIPRKYMAAHYLGFRVSDHFSLGFFETTIFQRDTSQGRFELQYLNPVILYRTVEHLLDSEDNILLGTDFTLNIWRRLRLYGQFVLDEFKFSEIKAGNGWWANKYGIQLGGLYVDAFGVDHLDFRAEFNTVRPYTYTHGGENGASYSHYNQPLAHPLGANFREGLAILTYRPAPKWACEIAGFLSKYGEDGPGQNFGGNILLDYFTREQDYGNETGQGIATTTLLLRPSLSYEIWHNLQLDLNYFFRKKDSADPFRSDTVHYFGIGLRWNSAPVRMDF